jgi:hypothetical protein
MLRTRDFILFIVVVAFLLLGISSSLLRGGLDSTVAVVDFVIPSQQAAVVTTTDTELTPDRAGIIARLKAKIADSELLSSAQPSVTPAEDTAATTTDEPTSEGIVTTLQRCGGASDGLATAALWPTSVVTIAVGEGARVVTTETEFGLQSLLQLPLAPQASGPHCLDSEVIGVTVHGSLIFNTDAIVYDTTSEATLIGYARDGFPIYGRSSTPTDSCGGYAHPSGYRYVLGDERPFMIGCFTGLPTQFNL